jgi:hypothetical protein
MVKYSDEEFFGKVIKKDISEEKSKPEKYRTLLINTDDEEIIKYISAQIAKLSELKKKNMTYINERTEVLNEFEETFEEIEDEIPEDKRKGIDEKISLLEGEITNAEHNQPNFLVQDLVVYVHKEKKDDLLDLGLKVGDEFEVRSLSQLLKTKANEKSLETML